MENESIRIPSVTQLYIRANKEVLSCKEIAKSASYFVPFVLNNKTTRRDTRVIFAHIRGAKGTTRSA